MSFEENARTTFGTLSETVAVTLSAMGADIVGVNCVGDFDLLINIVNQMKSHWEIHYSQPNAGIPEMVNGKTTYNIQPEEFAIAAGKLIKAGAGFIGGCCGTTPLHISELSKVAKSTVFPKVAANTVNAVTDNFDTIYLDPKGPIVIIGEHSNPSNNKKIQKELLSGNFSSIIKKAKVQLKNGAQIIDVNVGIPGEDEASLMKKIVQEFQKSVPASLCIDSSDAGAMEEGLKHFHGRAILNSVDGNPEKLERFLPIAKKYGSMIIGLTLDKKGVETTAKERLKIAERIIHVAGEFGIPAKDIIIDGLVLTVGAQQDYALDNELSA